MIPFIHFGSLSVPTYGLMAGIAMVCGFLVLKADLLRRGRSWSPGALALWPMLAGFLGAKLFHLLESPREFLDHPIAAFSHYGFAWSGGLLLGLLAVWTLAARSGKAPLEVFDSISPALSVLYGVGRIGCLLSGDGDYGVATTLPWGVSFPHGLVPTATRVHPTPLYECAAALLIAWLLWRAGGRSHLPPGRVFAYYLMLTGLARFLVEFIRINPRTVLGLTNAQVFSLVFIALGAGLWIRERFWCEIGSGDRPEPRPV